MTAVNQSEAGVKQHSDSEREGFWTGSTWSCDSMDVMSLLPRCIIAQAQLQLANNNHEVDRLSIPRRSGSRVSAVSVGSSASRT